MGGLGSISTPMAMSISLPFPHKLVSPNPTNHSRPFLAILKPHSLSLSSHFSRKVTQTLLTLKASSSVGTADYTEEPTTKVKFQTSTSLPGCSSSLSLLGTGKALRYKLRNLGVETIEFLDSPENRDSGEYITWNKQEKVFAIIGVKVYAAGLYADRAILSKLDAWKGKSAAQIQDDVSLFKSIFEVPLEKSLQIVLVRDVDGKTFWDALDEAISPRIKAPTPVDESALSIFRSIFLGRNLNKGTFIFLTWPEPFKMLVAVSSDGLPTSTDAIVESPNVASSLFDVFFGDTPVSPSLKASVASGLVAALK